VRADVLLVHKGHIYEEKGVWFYVYDGALRDCMLSKHLLSTIKSSTAPGHKLVDLDAGRRDDGMIQQLVSDMRHLEERVFVNSAKTLCKAQPLSEPTGNRPKLNAEAPRLQELLREMQEQRARLRERVGKPYSPEALRAAEDVLERFPDNFKPPGREPCKLGV
jgi:hypothetical protein